MLNTSQQISYKENNSSSNQPLVYAISTSLDSSLMNSYETILTYLYCYGGLKKAKGTASYSSDYQIKAKND